MHVDIDTGKIGIDAAADREWFDRIAKTANKISNDPTVQSYKIE
jgi:hypothetical protein